MISKGKELRKKEKKGVGENERKDTKGKERGEGKW
jgi:hypothetical protein